MKPMKTIKLGTGKANKALGDTQRYRHRLMTGPSRGGKGA